MNIFVIRTSDFILALPTKILITQFVSFKINYSFWFLHVVSTLWPGTEYICCRIGNSKTNFLRSGSSQIMFFYSIRYDFLGRVSENF